MSSTFGSLFKITTFGESHGGAVGVVIDGCPGNLEIDLGRIQRQLARRRPGQSHLATPRNEADEVVCLSGLENGRTLGSPICLLVYNKDANPAHYTDVAKVFRPSHADYTYFKKYGIKASSGGGRASARETIARVAAGAFAEQLIESFEPGYKCTAFVSKVHAAKFEGPIPESLSRELVDEHPVRSLGKELCAKMEKIIVDAKKKGDSVGGTITGVITGVSAGLGEPIFDKLQADLAKALMSLPATRSFEVGLGVAATDLFGSEHNDAFSVSGSGGVKTLTNRSGGIQGGISNGEPIIVTIGFKPVATIFKEQETVTVDGKATKFKPQAGRHDPCVLPRAVPMVEAMMSIVVADHLLRDRARKE